MPTKFAVLAKEIQAALLFASNDESRFVLNGVHFEMVPGKQPLLVATDGRRLAVIESAASQEAPTDEPSLPQALTINSDFLKPFCSFANSQALTVTVDFHNPKRVVLGLPEAHLFIDSEEGAVIEGDFPNWRAVIPQGEKEPVPEISLNAEFVSDFAKTAKLLGSDSPLIRMNLFKSDTSVEVLICNKPGFYGVIMPIKDESPARWKPQFLDLNWSNGK